MKLRHYATLILSLLMSGCSSCTEQEFFALLDKYEKISANWEPGEFDMVDRKREFMRQLREETIRTRDFSAGCKAMNDYIENDRIKGFH